MSNASLLEEYWVNKYAAEKIWKRQNMRPAYYFFNLNMSLHAKKVPYLWSTLMISNIFCCDILVIRKKYDKFYCMHFQILALFGTFFV